MRERVVRLGARGSLVGIATDPEARDPRHGALILINAGLVHRIGPHRLYVRIARAAARAGWSALRFDLSAIGDSAPRSDNVPFERYAPEEIRIAMDYLAGEGLRSFTLLGMCSGADAALRTALLDDRVGTVVLVNPTGIGSDADGQLVKQAATMTLSRYYLTRATSASAWRRLASGRTDVKAVARTLIRLAGQRLSVESGPEVKANLDAYRRLAERRIRTLLICSEGSTAWDILQLLSSNGHTRWSDFPNLELHRVKGSDHVFTPLWAQRELEAVVERWISNLSVGA